MTFKTLLSHSMGSNGLRLDAHGNTTVIPEMDKYNRADYHPPYGWQHKGGGHHSVKAGSALNALTLLAFLFFLNLLQNCLKENIITPQTPIVIVMSSDNSTDMNGTKVIRQRRDVREEDNNTNNDFISAATSNGNGFNYVASDSPEEQILGCLRNLSPRYSSHVTSKPISSARGIQRVKLIKMINANVNEYWTTEGKNRYNTMINKNRRGKRRQKSIDQDIFNFFKSFYTDDETDKTNNETTTTPEQPQKKTADNKNTASVKENAKKPDKKDKRINDRISNLQEHDYDDSQHTDHDTKDPTFFESIMWKTMESFKPGLRETAEDTVCCKLVACESSRLSKKLGGYVKYFMNRYIKRGLEWICKTEEKDMKHAFRIGREGKSCADEIEECKPKNFITDFVLFIDYLVI